MKNPDFKDAAYSIGKQYESERVLRKEDKTKDIEERIAKENSITTRTVRADLNFAQGIDIAENILPGMKEKILHGKDISISIDDVSTLHNLDEESQKRVVDALSKNDKKLAHSILKEKGASTPLDHKRESKGKPHIAPELEEPEPYNADDMLEDIRCANKNLNTVLYQDMVNLHNDILNTKEGRDKVLTGLQECQETVNKYIKLIKVREKNIGTRKKVFSD